MLPLILVAVGGYLIGQSRKEETFAKGGIYSSDKLYILKVFKDDELMDMSRRFWARNMKEAKQLAIEDYESEMKEKYGSNLHFRVEEAPSMMADGGKLFSNKSKRFVFIGTDGQPHGLNYRLIGIKKDGSEDTISEHTTQSLAERKAKKWSDTASPNYTEWRIDAIPFADGGIMSYQFADGGKIKSKKSLFKDLEEIDPVKFKGVNLNSKGIGNETFGKQSFIYIRCDSAEEKNRIMRLLEKKGHKIHSEYNPEGNTIEVRVGYFKGWHWDE